MPHCSLFSRSRRELGDSRNNCHEETVRVARAAFPRGNMYLTMRDQLGTLYEDQHFAALFPLRGRPADEYQCSQHCSGGRDALSIVLEEEMLSALILIQDSGSFRTLYARCRTALPVNCLFSTARNTVSPAVSITDPLS